MNMHDHTIRTKGLVQFITHCTAQYSYTDSARMALDGGCKWIQLRMKNSPESEVERVAWQIKEMCRTTQAVFIIDDYVELALRVGADGVHLGKSDMPIQEARAILGKDFIIGGTANTFDDVVQLYRAGVDYIGCGPFRYTETKKNLSPILGTEGYQNIIRQMKEYAIHIPFIVIGGITTADIPVIMQTGVTGIALSGSILKAKNPVSETKEIMRIIKQINIWKN